MDKLRAEFEEWWVRQEWDKKLHYVQGVMFNRIKESMFVAWKGSRAAVVVQLPAKRSDINRQGNFVPATCEAYDESIDDCADAIREVGISVKEADTER